MFAASDILIQLVLTDCLYVRRRNMPFRCRSFWRIPRGGWKELFLASERAIRVGYERSINVRGKSTPSRPNNDIKVLRVDSPPRSIYY
jgi:hypothetical protein